MTSLGPAVTQGPLGHTSMPCGNRVNGIAAGLLIKHTGGTHWATHSLAHTAAAVPAHSAIHSQRYTCRGKTHISIIIKGRYTKKKDRPAQRSTKKTPHLPQEPSGQVWPTSFCHATLTTPYLHQCIWADRTSTQQWTTDTVVTSRINGSRTNPHNGKM